MQRKNRHPRSYPKLFSNGKWRDAHRVVMEEYLGRELDREEVVHHLNGDITDFSIENLDIMLLSVHTSGHKIGRKNSLSKLNEHDILTIREYLESGESALAIAAVYGVHPTLIGKIKNRIIWAHVA